MAASLARLKPIAAGEAPTGGDDRYGRAIFRNMPPEANPFAILSLMVAPAILTNASSLLTMSTSNRLARAVDRARELMKQLEETADLSTPVATRRLNELSAAERRGLLLVAALQRFYLAMGGFALATFVSLLGAALAALEYSLVVQALELAGIAAGLIAVAALVHGSITLVRETRIALRVIQDRAEQIKSRAEFFPRATQPEGKL